MMGSRAESTGGAAATELGAGGAAADRCRAGTGGGEETKN